MKGWSTCPICFGKGSYLEEGDAHRSTGWVPCFHTPEKEQNRKPIDLNSELNKMFKGLEK